MRRIMFTGRSECGKTSLIQAMKGKRLSYHKTQYVNHYDTAIDTPGEYTQIRRYGGFLAGMSADCDVVGLVISATEPCSVFPPNCTAACSREVVGIVSKCDHRLADPDAAAEWLRLAGCEKIFLTSAYTGQGIADLLSYLREE